MRKRSPIKKILIIANIVALLGFAGGTGYLFFENRDLNNQLTLTDEQKRDRLLSEINDVFDLPDELPEVVIVTDPEKFKSEYTTFDNVENGDHLLVFRKARLGVLYRQSDKRVVKTTTIVIPITIELIGSRTAVDAAEGKLLEFGSQVTVIKTVNEGIAQSFVFDVDSDQESETASISKQLGYDVVSVLPTSITPATQTEVIVLIADSPAAATPAQAQP